MIYNPESDFEITSPIISFNDDKEAMLSLYSTDDDYFSFEQVIIINGVINGIMIDTRDNSQYNWVDIEGIRWFSDNLNFNDGHSGISSLALSDDSIKIGNYYTYNSLFDIGSEQDICPQGWEVPNEEDWNELEDFSEFNSENVKISDHWPDANNNTNKLGLNIYPAGYIDEEGALVDSMLTAYFWSIESPTDSTAWDRNFKSTDSLFSDVERSRNIQLSVRCINRNSI
jgi:uncharacterized protein (TIGR02145 family)